MNSGERSLRDYVRHLPGCNHYNTSEFDSSDCTCGLDSALRTAGEGAGLEVCRKLDLFQRSYDANTMQKDRMPGNDYYSEKAMAIVREARESLAARPAQEPAPLPPWIDPEHPDDALFIMAPPGLEEELEADAKAINPQDPAAQGRELSAAELLSWFESRPGTSWKATIRDVKEAIEEMAKPTGGTASGEGA